MIAANIEEANKALLAAPILTGIENEQDYEAALELIDQMFDDYDKYRLLIGLLSEAIAKWEDTAPEFADFNAEIESLDTGIAVLKVLMDQHGLKAADLPELGSKANVSKILNATDGKRLTRTHIEALSKRFGVSPALFFDA